MLATLFGLAVPVLLIKNHPDVAILMLLPSGYCGTLDRTIARLQNTTSDFGTILDILSGRIVECAAVFGLYLVNPLARSTMAIGMLISILICVISFLVVRIFTKKNSQNNFHYNPGLMERAEAFFCFIAMILLPGYFTQPGLIFIILVLWTVFVRVINFKK